MNGKVLMLVPLCVLAASCQPRPMVFIDPGEYRLASRGGALGVTGDSYFIAASTGFPIHSEDKSSFCKMKQKSGELGHWYLAGSDYLMDIAWKGCDLESMPSFFQGGVDEYIQLLWSDEAKGITMMFNGIEVDGRACSAKISYSNNNTGETASFVFSQRLD
ncbi:MAG: hypothetical protein J6328_02775 [Bacilli bacterium]|nr:hypothetical protein [Bacilli bacterium]